MSSLLICQTILCLAVPPVISVMQQETSVDNKNSVHRSSRGAIIPATNILNHLIAVNPFVRFSQSDANGNIVVDGTNYHYTNYYSPIGIVGNRYPKPAKPNKRPYPLKIFGEGTENRFGPLLEYIVQRIQSQFSNYIHEDLSRPSLNSPVELDPDIHSTPYIYVDGAEPTEVDSIEINPTQDTTAIPIVSASEEDEGSGGWLTVNK